MPRGFLVRLNIQDSSELTSERVIDEAHAQAQRLSEIEITKFVPGAVAAAKALVDAVAEGPFFVTINGVDSFGVHGEATILYVSVDTAATVLPGQGPITEVMTSKTDSSPSTEANESSADPATPASVEPLADTKSFVGE